MAWEDEAVALGPAVAGRMEEGHAAFAAYLRARLAEDPGALLYGITTGPGDAGGAVLSERARATRPPGLWTAASFGEPLPRRVVRAIVLARLANLVDGHAGARPALAAAVAALLDGGPLPAVPARGNGGSGEILALGHLFGDLAERMELEPREKMALINGSPCAAALVADAALAGQGRVALAERVLALSAEAIRAPLDAFSPELGALWGDEHETRALESLTALLAGGAGERQAHQAPVSHRVLPRVLGRLREAQAHAERTAAGALASVTDNPVFLPPSAARPLGAVVSNGGYHNDRAHPALDGLAHAWADVAQLAQRHVDQLFQHPASAPLLSVRVARQAAAHDRGRLRRGGAHAGPDHRAGPRRLRPERPALARVPRVGEGGRHGRLPRAGARRAGRARLPGAARRRPPGAARARAVPRRGADRVPPARRVPARRDGRGAARRRVRPARAGLKAA